MNIILVQTEKEGKLYGKRFLQSAKGSLIRIKKQHVAQLVQHRMKMATLANNVVETPKQAIQSLFSPATFSY